MHTHERDKLQQTPWRHNIAMVIYCVHYTNASCRSLQQQVTVKREREWVREKTFMTYICRRLRNKCVIEAAAAVKSLSEVRRKEREREIKTKICAIYRMHKSWVAKMTRAREMEKSKRRKQQPTLTAERVSEWERHFYKLCT